MRRPDPNRAGIQLVADPGKPVVRGQAVRPELLRNRILFAVVDRPIDTKLARNRRIDNRARIAGTHLEQYTHVELADHLAFKRSVQVIQAIAPDDGVDAVRRSLA